MPKLEMFAVCESCSIDQASNRLSLFNILEETNSAGLPVLLPGATIVSLWLFEPAEFGRDVLARITVRRPGGDVVKDFPQAFTVEARRHRVVMTVERFAFDVSGDWEFELRMNEAVTAHHVVTVNPPVPEVGTA